MTQDDEELIFYLKEYYKEWIQSSVLYYFYEDGGDESKMSDEMWTALASNYKKYIKEFPFLKSIDFNGSTLGVGVTKQQLVDELEKQK